MQEYQEQAHHFGALQQLMVKQQLEPRGIKDKAVLKAMGIVPRHFFVPSYLRDLAYRDEALPIGHGQTISQPYIVAFMIQAAELTKDSKVLDIGTGCGYQAAVLSRICSQVFTVEIVKPLGQNAIKTLAELDYSNIKIRLGDGYEGWPDEAPFDAILVAAATPKVPAALLNQLKEKGRLIVPIEEASYQHLKKYTKYGDSIKEEELLRVIFVPMTGKGRKFN